MTSTSLLPALDDLGFKIAQQGRDPAAPPAIDSTQVIYTRQGSRASVQVRIYVIGTADLAHQQYTAFAESFRNPPSEVLGVPSKNVDTPSPRIGDEQKSYVTDKPDGQGNSVWTDIYRAGRVVFLTQVLDSATVDQLPTREAIARRIASKVK